MVPADWNAVGMGIFMRGTPPEDVTTIALQSAPVTVEQLWPSLLPQLALEEAPEATGSLTTPVLEWALYGVDIDLPAVFVLQPMLAFGVALPTPGGAGGYHAAMKAGLVYLLGVPAAQAVTAAILAHLVVVVPILLLGVVLMWVEKLSMKDLVAAARGVRDLGAELGPPGETQPMEGKP